MLFRNVGIHIFPPTDKNIKSYIDKMYVNYFTELRDSVILFSHEITQNDPTN